MSPTPTERTPTPDPPREELARLEEDIGAVLRLISHADAMEAQHADYYVDGGPNRSQPLMEAISAAGRLEEYRTRLLSTLPHADAPKLSNDGRPVMPEGCAEAADMRPALQVARKDAPSPVAAGPSKEATMGGVKLTDDHEYTDLEWAEILERMAGVYPGDPTGALMREACALRGVPYDPPEVTITVFDDDGRVIDDAGRAALRGAGDV